MILKLEFKLLDFWLDVLRNKKRIRKMTKIYLVEELCSLPGDSRIIAYSTKEKAIDKFEHLLEEHIENYEEELLKELEEIHTLEAFKKLARKDLAYSFYDDCMGLIWLIQIKTMKVL